MKLKVETVLDAPDDLTPNDIAELAEKIQAKLSCVELEDCTLYFNFFEVDITKRDS